MFTAFPTECFPWRKGWTQAPLLALIIIALAAYGPLVHGRRIHQQPLTTTALDGLQAGFQPAAAIGKLLGKNVKLVGGIVSIGAGAISIVAGTGAISLMALSGGLALGVIGVPLMAVGLGVVGLGGWLIERHFSGRGK